MSAAHAMRLTRGRSNRVVAAYVLRLLYGSGLAVCTLLQGRQLPIVYASGYPLLNLNKSVLAA